MPIGPGKYGANAEQLLRRFGGSLCVVFLIGNKGPGFDVATIDPALVHTLPALLREIAVAIEQDLSSGPGPVS